MPIMAATMELLALRTAYREAVTRSEVQRARHEAAARTRELGELTRIGMALATERDYNTLLDLILTQARQITGSDAGSLYVVEAHEPDTKRLRFKMSQNHSRPDMPLVEFTMPIDHSSISGYVAATGEPLVIDDTYFLPPDVEYTFNRSIDEKYGYRTKSMMTIPMKDHKDEVIGVLQLVNRKREYAAELAGPADVDAQVIPYTRRNVEIVGALAGQAAVSIENSQLYESIERLFEGFVKASVTAIEARDPTTSGHSFRVANLTVALAEAAERCDTAPFTEVRFTRQEMKEIRYASLLHDFGKVGVREEVLVKAKKLYPSQMELIRKRFLYIRKAVELEQVREKMEYLLANGNQNYQDPFAAIDGEHGKELQKLDEFLDQILKANEPTVLPEKISEKLVEIAGWSFEDPSGPTEPLLSPEELRFLSIPKGSLDPDERLQIESHVIHSFRFLSQIPWTKELKNIPMIARAHHEKLDGSGYPYHMKAEEIPFQAKMMTISDIFDALTARDRPYKRAVPIERALDIIGQEVKSQLLDPVLFHLFLEAKIFRMTTKD